MEVIWTRGASSIREIHYALPLKGRPAFTTLGTMVCRLEKKLALRCVKRIGSANIVEAVIGHDEAHTRLDPQRGQVDVIVIDSAERPTAD